MSKVEWADFKFPSINLLVMPRHNVLLEHIGQYYADSYGFLWEDFKEKFNEGSIVITIKAEHNE